MILTNLSTPNFHSWNCEVTPNLWETQFYKFIYEFFYTRNGTELVPIFHHCSVVSTFDWMQHRVLLLVMHSFPLMHPNGRGKYINWPWIVQNHEHPQKKVIQLWIILQSSKRMHRTTANRPIAYTVCVWLPKIGNCYITNLYSLWYRYRLLDVEMMSVFQEYFLSLACWVPSRPIRTRSWEFQLNYGLWLVGGCDYWIVQPYHWSNIWWYL